MTLLQLAPFIETVTAEPLALKDFALGFFMALALKRGRISALLDSIMPTASTGATSDEAQTDTDEMTE